MSPMERLLGALRSLSLDPETAVAERVAPLLYFDAPEASFPDSAEGLLRERGEKPPAFRGTRRLIGGCFRRARPASRHPQRRRFREASLSKPGRSSDGRPRPLGSAGGGRARGECSRIPRLSSPAPEMSSGTLARDSPCAALRRCETRRRRRPPLVARGTRHPTDVRRASTGFASRVADSRLDATASLLYLAAHMKLQHYDERSSLIWLSDFYLLSQRPEVDLERPLRRRPPLPMGVALAATAAEVEARLGLPSSRSLARRAPNRRWRIPEHKGGPERAWNELQTLSFPRPRGAS